MNKRETIPGTTRTKNDLINHLKDLGKSTQYTLASREFNFRIILRDTKNEIRDNNISAPAQIQKWDLCFHAACCSFTVASTKHL